jgi:hypothetical protein
LLLSRDSFRVIGEYGLTALDLVGTTRKLGVAIAGGTLLRAKLVVKSSESRERVVDLSRKGVEHATEASVGGGDRRAEL